MEINIGKTDRRVRLILGIVSIYFAYMYSPWIYIITAILIGTSLVGFCGLYKILGINKSKSKKKKRK